MGGRDFTLARPRSWSESGTDLEGLSGAIPSLGLSVQILGLSKSLAYFVPFFEDLKFYQETKLVGRLSFDREFNLCHLFP